jgi:hypothetical protein
MMKLRFRADRMTLAFRKETRNASATIRPGSESHAQHFAPQGRSAPPQPSPKAIGGPVDNYRTKRQRWGNPMTDAEHPTNAFKRFFEAFPERDGGNDLGAARMAWRGAVACGADPQTIIAGALAYAAATEGRPRRYIMSARRWLNESRWREVDRLKFEGVKPRLIWIEYGSPEWWAWSNHWRTTKGKSPPVDAKGGWRFPSLTPSKPQQLAA